MAEESDDTITEILEPYREAIRYAWLKETPLLLNELKPLATLPAEESVQVQLLAEQLILQVRDSKHLPGGIEAFMQEYGLNTQEGITLMCLAEALLRIPDTKTRNRFIQSQVHRGDWEKHLGHSHSLFVNASTWGLVLSGQILDPLDSFAVKALPVMKRLVRRSGQPVIRGALFAAIKLLGEHFVMGNTIEQAIRRTRQQSDQNWRYSYDMLGEAALTTAAADQYFTRYRNAIAYLAKQSDDKALHARPSISIKLSALHPRLENCQKASVMRQLLPALTDLIQFAAASNVPVTIDAEETQRLEITLDLFAALHQHPTLKEWNGLGIAVQAYQKRALTVIDWLGALAEAHQKIIPIRLVKGAYWDTEIKHAQILGLPDYPVFTAKAETDVCYLACARKLLAYPNHFYPMFATHNAQTLATILAMAPTDREIEFQRLHGMGEQLYRLLLRGQSRPLYCRTYAPVGNHDELLPYLVRRLLENGANTSFVNHMRDEDIPVEQLIADPVMQLYRSDPQCLALPPELYGGKRQNSLGYDIQDPQTQRRLSEAVNTSNRLVTQATPLVSGVATQGDKHSLWNPARLDEAIGSCLHTLPNAIESVMQAAAAGYRQWHLTPIDTRATCLLNLANLLEEQFFSFVTLLIKEAGKTYIDSINEVREAIDFCRYYAQQSKTLFTHCKLPGPVGERNELRHQARGVFICISPWNFPLAIFVGQIAAALVTGNSVVAKPAEQTPLIATATVRLFHRAGIPVDALHLLPGPGETIGTQLVAHPLTSGVAFTGSVEVAHQINQTMATSKIAIRPLVAETGGINAMIVDPTALIDQVVKDTIQSAFHSAGQRCSALRLLCVHESVADQTIAMISGAMAELRVGDPALLETDIGPVIDATALNKLERHKIYLQRIGKICAQTPLDEKLNGHYFAPLLAEIDSPNQLKEEIFGPILHLIRYREEHLETLLDQINQTGYGLTLGIHSRLQETVDYIAQKMRIGNIYVNRNMVGAVVGVQPFGGVGLSGTGPKAGGPNYLSAFTYEQTMSTNTAAIGGDVSLLQNKI